MNTISEPTQTDQVEVELARLRWRCRRGMLELDLLLQAFLNDGFERLSESEKHHFYRLLDEQDQHLLELLMLQTTTEDAGLNDIINKIRSAV